MTPFLSTGGHFSFLPCSAHTTVTLMQKNRWPSSRWISGVFRYMCGGGRNRRLMSLQCYFQSQCPHFYQQSLLQLTLEDKCFKFYKLIHLPSVFQGLPMPLGEKPLCIYSLVLEVPFSYFPSEMSPSSPSLPLTLQGSRSKPRVFPACFYSPRCPLCLKTLSIS